MRPARLGFDVLPDALQSAVENLMSKSRRDFLISSSTALIFNTFIGAAGAPKMEAQTQTQTPPPAGTPPVFGVAPAVGPEVSAATFADAEKLVQVELNDRDRAQVAQNWRSSMAAVYERRTGPRKLAIPESIPPYSQINPVLPGHQAGPASNRF